MVAIGKIEFDFNVGKGVGLFRLKLQTEDFFRLVRPPASGNTGETAYAFLGVEFEGRGDSLPFGKLYGRAQKAKTCGVSQTF